MLPCDACGEEASGVMSWENKEGSSKYKLCPACILAARKMLDGRFYILRPIRRAVVLSERDKTVLAKMSPSSFMKAVDIGYPESLLISLVNQGFATMTKCDSSIQFKRKG